jgi:hypothetical protein
MVMQRDKADEHGPRTGAGGSINRSGGNDSERDLALGENEAKTTKKPCDTF